MTNRTGEWIRQLGRGIAELGGLAKDLWNTAETIGPCCGIRLDRELRPGKSPLGTAGSCCGVRM